MNISQVVNAYMKCGETAGFFMAEMILLKYLPAKKPEGVCRDVAARNWPSFVAELNAATRKAKADKQAA
jgi:predicted lipoprotein with Yx(FWY)xxD motif